MSDEELLRAYATERSEEAFAELVRRHAGAVQAAAMRQTRNAHLAEEVTHAVFLQLARKAGTLRPGVVLLGWLLRAARYAAIDAVRAQASRQRRETDFLAMQPTESTPSPSESDSLWSSVAPLLDEALMRLREKDRDALLLRFFEDRSLAAVGAALGVPEDAARKRVQRALERLHAHLSRKGAMASITVLPNLLTTHAAPGGSLDLVRSATGVALATAESSANSISLLAVAVGRRLFWAAARPWLIGVTLVGLGLGTLSSVLPRQGTSSPVVGGDDWPGDDYRPAGFPDAAVVRGFVAELQRDLAANRRSDLARAIRYPLRVNTPEGALLISNEAGFLDRFDGLFRPNVVGVILKSPNRRLYCDARGVMVGDGTVWIAPSDNAGRTEPRIIALNLP